MEIFLKAGLPILITGIVFIIRLEGKIKILVNELKLLSAEYKSMVGEYKKLNELYVEMRMQVQSNTQKVGEIEVLKAALKIATSDS